MLFNTIEFLLFYIIVTLSFFGLGARKQLALLLIASCYFYIYFIPKYLLILFAVIIIDYFAGRGIEKSSGSKRKALLAVSLGANLGVLFFFKYFNFASENLNALADTFGHAPIVPYLKIALPIGLSFHTFQAMSYTIEVFRGAQKVERNFLVYALYVLFYPQLVAGPIERPQNLLPQLHERHSYDPSNLRQGLFLMAWGMFKKVVVADRLAILVDAAYGSVDSSNGITLLIATFCFAIQIYCDFSGYSDVARGAARTMGIHLMVNFRNPYFSQSISEFWRRWHISLSSWFRDYVYIPLGGNKVGELRVALNIMAVFLLSGLWHGANWNYVIWGAIHGLYVLGERLKDRVFGRNAETANACSWRRVRRVLTTFLLVSFAWIFFRARSLSDALTVIRKLTHFSLDDPLDLSLNCWELLAASIFIGVCLFAEDRVNGFAQKTGIRFWIGLFLLICVDYFCGIFRSNQFIYFQF